MPFHLKDRDIDSDIAAVRSALIVPCRFCPAASLAVRESKPYLSPFRRLLRTAAYESYIQRLKARLESRGIRTGILDGKLPHHFVVCMWASRRRNDLTRRALEYDAAIVLGCDAAVDTVRSCLPATCRAVAAMEVEGIMSVIPTLQFPLDISLQVSSTTRVLQRQDAAGRPLRAR